jgi:hypothetical protein
VRESRFPQQPEKHVENSGIQPLSIVHVSAKRTCAASAKDALVPAELPHPVSSKNFFDLPGTYWEKRPGYQTHHSSGSSSSGWTAGDGCSSFGCPAAFGVDPMVARLKAKDSSHVR